MLFKDLKAGDMLYLFDSNIKELSIEKVVNISIPRMDGNMNNGMVVDISLQNKIYTIKNTSEICYNGSLVISPNKDLVLKEVESCKENDLSILARKDSIEEGIKKLDVIIDQLSPERKEKKEQDERLNRIEESVGALKDMVELIIKQRTNGNGGVSKEV
jgi:hypothetical protein